VVGFEEVGSDAWAVLGAAGLRVVAVGGVSEALCALAEHSAQVVIADARGRALLRAVRRDPQLAAVHVVLCAALDSVRELRAALDAGAMT
jgi:CheY-like chemotaxis protein